MTTTDDRLEALVAEWRTYLRRRPEVRAADVEELEDHLRMEVATLRDGGLDADEAFLVAVKRLGALDVLSREFALEHSERLWKQLVTSPEADETTPGAGRDALTALGFAVAAAVAVKVPELFGVRIAGPGGPSSFYLRNFTLLVLPFLAAYFAVKRGLSPARSLVLAVPFVAAAAVMNLLPFHAHGHTEVLAALHLPMVLWLATGIAYVGGRWRDHDQRMNFVRFSGEWFIYYTLIALGGGVLMGCTVAVFDAVGIKPDAFLQTWVLPCGVAGAVLVAAWLVEAKQSVIENMAPVLTRVFTPLFTLMLVVFLGAVAWTGNGVDVGREVLIAFDLLLVVVLGLLLFSISARDPLAAPGFFDVLQLALVVSALLVDAFALWAIAARISELGLTPNKVAALGENAVLLVNLTGTAWLYGRFLARRSAFADLERWQTAYLPVYGAWAAVVVIVFPIVFGYR